MFDKVLSMPQILNKVLNMSLVPNVLKFWIYQGSEYDSGYEYAKILNKSEF